MVALPLPLTTPRLILRHYEADDLGGLHDMFSREDVCRYLPWEPMDLDQARAKLERRLEQDHLEADGDPLILVAVDQATGRYIGELMLRLWSVTSRQGEIGWSFHPDVQGRGLATEGAREVLRLGFEVVGLHRIWAGCDARNAASLRVMERLGMRHEATYIDAELHKGEWATEIVYGLLEDEWRAQGVAGKNRTQGGSPWTPRTSMPTATTRSRGPARSGSSRSASRRTSRTSSRPSGRTVGRHVAGIGALWIDGRFYFTSGEGTRKSRDLAEREECVIAVKLPDLDLVVEGTATRVTDKPTLDRLAKAFDAQGWPATVDEAEKALTAPYSAPSAGPAPWNLYEFTPDEGVRRRHGRAARRDTLGLRRLERAAVGPVRPVRVAGLARVIRRRRRPVASTRAIDRNDAVWLATSPVTVSGWCHRRGRGSPRGSGGTWVRRSSGVASTRSRSTSARYRHTSNARIRSADRARCRRSANESRAGIGMSLPRTVTTSASSATISASSGSCKSPSTGKKNSASSWA